MIAQLVNNTFQVRQKCDVELRITCSEPLGQHQAIEVQFPNSWLMISGPSFTRKLQTADPGGEHFVGVEAHGAKFDVQVRPRHLNYHQGACRHGQVIVATLTGGEIQPGATVTLRYANTFAPYIAERETVHVSVAGQPAEAMPEIVVLPGLAVRTRVLAPSCVRVGESFEILVVSLDEFDNCSGSRFTGQCLRRGDGVIVVDGLDFTGSIRVAAKVDSPGVFRFSMGGVTSNAVHVGDGPRLYWGDLHIHTKLSSDGMGADPYGYARDVSALDFAATADHRESLGEEGYRRTVQWIEQANRPGKFAAIPADERNPAAFGGHHNLYFRSVEGFLAFRALGSDAQPLPDDPGQAMFVPHHTGISWGALGKGNAAVDMGACDDGGMRPVVEIYSHHGQSELYSPQHILAYGLNRMRNPERRSNSYTPGAFYAQDYWMAGRRLGVIGSSDEHSGQGGRRHGGLAAVWADELTREGVFDAIRNRRCYATTGERILVEFSVGGATMGQAISRPKGTKLPIRLAVWGTDLLLIVEILRFRRGIDRAFVPIVSVPPRPESTDFACELDDELTGETIYYARITQGPLDLPGMAWTSPIWIDTSK